MRSEKPGPKAKVKKVEDLMELLKVLCHDYTVTWRGEWIVSGSCPTVRASSADLRAALDAACLAAGGEG